MARILEESSDDSLKRAIVVIIDRRENEEISDGVHKN
jgi:hypothetical protein